MPIPLGEDVVLPSAQGEGMGSYKFMVCPANERVKAKSGEFYANSWQAATRPETCCSAFITG